MHYWPSKQVHKSSSRWDVKSILANRPKGISDEDWAEIVKDAKMNKLIILDKVPKTSKRSGAPRRAQVEE